MYGGSDPPVCSISSLFTGWALGSEMIPTLAHRVWPRTETVASGPARARRRRRSAATAPRSARVLSPSSPISAAALYTIERQRPTSRAEPFTYSGSAERVASTAAMSGSSPVRP